MSLFLSIPRDWAPLRAPQRARLLDARAPSGRCSGDAAELLAVYGVEDVALGDLDLMPGLKERARAEKAMPRWPSLEGKRSRRTDRSAVSGKRYRAAGGAWPPDLSKHISTVPSTGKMPPPGARMGPRGRSASCGNGLFAQCVRLRSEIDPFRSFLKISSGLKYPTTNPAAHSTHSKKQSANTPLCLRTHIKNSYDQRRI